MDPNDKQERRIARQRGAGPRALTDSAAFAFSFAAPSAPSPTRALNSGKTPRAASRTPATSRKRKRKSHAPAATPAGAAIADAEQVDELSPDAPAAITSADLPQLKRVSIPLLAPNRLRKERPAPSPDRRPPREERGRSRTRKSIVSVSLSQSRPRLDALSEENEDELLPTPVGKREKRRRAPVLVPSPGQDALSPDIGLRGTSRRGTIESAATRDPEDNGLELTPAPSAAQRRRTELNMHRDSARALPGTDGELTPDPSYTRKQPSEIEILADPEPELNLDVSELDELSPRSNTDTRLRSPLAEAHSNISRPPGKPPTKTAQSRQPGPETTQAVENEETRPRKKQKTARAEKKKAGPTVPITIYRRTVPDDDPLGIDPSPIPSMHPSDVLSQISSEVLNRYMATAANSASKDGNTGARRKALRQRLQALESFREGLADSLRGITFARHGMFKFSAEVRRERKRKRELREVLVGLRREREGLEVEIDSVRAGIERNQEEQGRREKMERDLLGIAEVVRLGREVGGVVDDTDEGVAENDGGGLLEKLRAFRGNLISSSAS